MMTAKEHLLAVAARIVDREVLDAELAHRRATRAFRDEPGWSDGSYERVRQAQERCAAATLNARPAGAAYQLLRAAMLTACAVAEPVTYQPRSEDEARRMAEHAAHALEVWPVRLVERLREVERASLAKAPGAAGKDVALALELGWAVVAAVKEGSADGDDAARCDECLRQVALTARDALPPGLAKVEAEETERKDVA